MCVCTGLASLCTNKRVDKCVDVHVDKCVEEGGEVCVEACVDKCADMCAPVFTAKVQWETLYRTRRLRFAKSISVVQT